MDGVPEASSRPIAPAAVRAIAVLQVLARSAHPLPLSEVAARCGLPKSSTSDLLRSLEHSSMARRAGHRWTIGWKAIELGLAAQRLEPLVTEYEQHAEEFGSIARESSVLAVAERGEFVVLARRLRDRPGTTPPPPPGDRVRADGTALAAAMTAAVRALRASGTGVDRERGSGALERVTWRPNEQAGWFAASIAARDVVYVLAVSTDLRRLHDQYRARMIADTSALAVRLRGRARRAFPEPRDPGVRSPFDISNATRGDARP